MDDNFNDHFMDEQANEPQTEQHVETEQEREEREIAESTIERRHNTLRLILLGAIAVLTLGLGWWLWARYFNPYEEGQMKGWILSVVSQGTMMKSVEGTMLTITYADDEIIGRDTIPFTITNDSIVMEAKRWSADGRRLVVDYQRYHGSLPWRGNSNCIITNIQQDTIRVETLGPVPANTKNESTN